MTTTTTAARLEPGEGYELYRHSTGLGLGLDEASQWVREMLLRGTSVPVAANGLAYKLGTLYSSALHLRGTWEYEATDEALFWCGGDRREALRAESLATAALADLLAEQFAALRERILAVKAASTGKGDAQDWAELAAVADRITEVGQWLGHNAQA